MSESLVSLSQVGNILSNIGNKIVQNQNIMKLLYYNTPDALAQPDVGVLEIADMLGKTGSPDKQRIYKYLISDMISEEVKTELRFGIDRIHPENRHIVALPITLQIVCHNSIWELDNNKLRVFVLLEELLDDLNGNIDDVNGIGGLLLKSPITFVNFNSSFSGYVLLLNTRSG